MNIVQVIDNLAFGGAQRMQVVFAQAIRPYNFKLTVIGLNSSIHKTTTQEELEALGAKVVFFPSHLKRLSLDPLRVLQMARFMRQEQFDVVHSHLTYANITGTLAGRLAGIPTIASLRNAIYDKSSNFYAIGGPLETMVLRKVATRIMAVGEATAAAHQERLKGRTIEPIPSAVALMPTLSAAERQEVRRELTGDPNRPLLISVGRLGEQKGFDDLLNGFAIVHQKHPQAVLVIAGGGDLRDPLSAQIKALALENHAFLLGRRTDIPRLLGASDLFISSSLWEGLPVSVLEAMSAGLPIVATNVDDTPNIVKGKAGIVVPAKSPTELGRAMNYYLDNPSEMKIGGMAAQAHIIQHHDPAQWIKKFIALYDSIRLK